MLLCFVKHFVLLNVVFLSNGDAFGKCCCICCYSVTWYCVWLNVVALGLMLLHFVKCCCILFKCCVLLNVVFH